jgi:tetratricopeptide (TPR) repeat protein
MMSFRFAFALLAVCSSLSLSACSVLQPQANDVYELREKAQIAYAGEQDDKAEKLLLGLARSAPSEPETWFTLGNLYARTNRPDQAVDAYQKALMLNSTDAKVWHNLGVVRVRQAWAAFAQSYALTKDNPGDEKLRAKVEGLITAMETLPLEGLSRSEKSRSDKSRLDKSSSDKTATDKPTDAAK